MNQNLKIHTPLFAPLDIDRIAEADTETLLTQLAQTIGFSAKLLSYWAALWAELVRREVDLSHLRDSLPDTLPLIAAGKLDPELVVRYTTKRMFLNAASRLPLNSQKEMLEAGTVRLVTVDRQGNVEREEIPIQRLKSNDIRYIFAEGHIRPEAEQIELRRKAQRLAAKTRPPRKTRNVELDSDRGALVVGGMAVPVEKALELISTYYDLDFETFLKNHQATKKALGAFEGKKV